MTRTRLPDGLYAQLEPEERFRLTLAAVARGDAQEYERLETTCPRKLYSMADAAVADLVHASREAALFFTIIFQHLLHQAELAWARLELMRAFIAGHDHGVGIALDLTVGPAADADEDDEFSGDGSDSGCRDDDDSRRREGKLGAQIRGEYEAWVAALAGLYAGFVQFCEDADLKVDEVLAWSPVGVEAVEQADVYLSKPIPPNSTWAAETCSACHGYWPELRAQTDHARS